MIMLWATCAEVGNCGGRGACAAVPPADERLIATNPTLASREGATSSKATFVRGIDIRAVSVATLPDRSCRHDVRSIAKVNIDKVGTPRRESDARFTENS
jgi:hypothetical protein